MANSDKEKKLLMIYNKLTPKERKRYESLSSYEQRQIDLLGAVFGSIRLFTEIAYKKNHGSAY